MIGMEKRRLLHDEKEEEPDEEVRIQHGYGSSSSSEESVAEEVIPGWISTRPRLVKIYRNRQRIPGYGLWLLVRQSSLYALYVLLIMLLVYLLNQLDRYTISITARYVGFDVGFGDLRCLPNFTALLSPEYDIPRSVVYGSLIDNCTNKSIYENSTTCPEYETELTSNNGTSFYTEPCVFTHDGTKGYKYQVLAGSVFNNVYPVAGIFAGILADNFNRKVLLALSLAFWSIATGVTGFATKYWMLVIFRILLAIGAAGCSPFAISILSDYFPPTLRGTALGIYYWGIYLGYSLAYAIGNEINLVLNWRWVFFLSGIFGLVLAPVVLFTIKESRKRDYEDGPPIETKKGFKERLESFGRKGLLLLITFIMPGMFMLCIAGGIRNAGGYVWAYNTQPFFTDEGYHDNVIASFMSVIPLVAGSIGAVVGGLVSDWLVKGRGPYVRIWVLIVSQLLAAPFAAGALFMPFPWNFLSLIPSNVIGEMWVGVTSAIVIDLSPARIRTSAIALYLFIITVIGGNFNIIVAPLEKAIPGNDVNKDRWALFLTFPMLYALSSLLFLLTFFLMRVDLIIKRRTEECSLNSIGRTTPDEE